MNGYLTKPTTRLARYPLLLEAVLKHTREDNPDKKELPQVVEIIRNYLKAVNAETGKAENRFNLLQLEQQLITREGEKPVGRFTCRGWMESDIIFIRTCDCTKKVVSLSTRAP